MKEETKFKLIAFLVILGILVGLVFLISDQSSKFNEKIRERYEEECPRLNSTYSERGGFSLSNEEKKQ